MFKRKHTQVWFTVTVPLLDLLLCLSVRSHSPAHTLWLMRSVHDVGRLFYAHDVEDVVL